MRTVARLITEVCLHCSLTSMLSGVHPRVAFGNPHSSMHPLSIIHHPSTPHRPERCWPPRDSIISSSVLTRPAACQPATGLVMSWSLACPVLPPRVALGPVRPRTESQVTQVSCGGMTRVLVHTVLYSAARTSCTRLVCACLPHSPAEPSPAHFVFCLCIFLIMLHLPSFASWHLITEATTRAPVLHSPLCPGEDPCFSAPSPSGGAVVLPSLRPTHIFLDCPLGRQAGTMHGVHGLHIRHIGGRYIVVITWIAYCLPGSLGTLSCVA